MPYWMNSAPWDRSIGLPDIAEDRAIRLTRSTTLRLIIGIVVAVVLLKAGKLLKRRSYLLGLADVLSSTEV
jgi:hypothetical protein